MGEIRMKYRLTKARKVSELPEIIPPAVIHCKGCMGVTYWTGYWSEVEGKLIFVFTHDGCNKVTLQEYQSDGKISTRESNLEKENFPK
jgi:hypothetical protein